MIDRQQALNKQITNFMNEFQHRFSNLNHDGMPGKLAFTTKLNLKENCSLNIYLTDRFPLDSPILYVIPKIDNEILDSAGRVKDSCVTIWNINSTLVSAVRTILLKLEGGENCLGISSQNLLGFQNSNQIYSNNINIQGNSQVNYSLLYTNNNQNITYNQNNNNNNQYQQNQNNIYNIGNNINQNTYNVNNNNNMMNSRSSANINQPININNNDKKNSKSTDFNLLNYDEQIYNQQNKSKGKSNVNIEQDLNSKSIEELIYIFNNQEEYVKEYMSPYRKPIDELKSEVNILCGKILI